MFPEKSYFQSLYSLRRWLMVSSSLRYSHFWSFPISSNINKGSKPWSNHICWKLFVLVWKYGPQKFCIWSWLTHSNCHWDYSHYFLETHLVGYTSCYCLHQLPCSFFWQIPFTSRESVTAPETPDLIALTMPGANEEVKIPWRLHGDHKTHLVSGDSPVTPEVVCWMCWVNFSCCFMDQVLDGRSPFLLMDYFQLFYFASSFSCAKYHKPMLEPLTLMGGWLAGWLNPRFMNCQIPFLLDDVFPVWFNLQLLLVGLNRSPDRTVIQISGSSMYTAVCKWFVTVVVTCIHIYIYILSAVLYPDLRTFQILLGESPTW